jgi:type I restriction enzyme S subunit
VSWPLVKLHEVAQVNPRLPKDVDETQQVIFLPMAAISEQGQILEQEKRILSETRKGFTYFEKNDVVVAKITPCFENGKAAFLDDLETQIGFGTTEFHVIRPDIEKLDGKYLFYLVWNKWFRHLGERNMSGSAGQKRVPTDFLKSLEIPLPPLDEQKRIAAILDKADAIRRKRQQAINLADDFLRSVFLDMFGDPLVNPKKWSVETLGKLTTKITDGKHGDCEDESDSGYYFISAKDVNHGIINYKNTRQINKKEFDEVHRRTDLKSGDIVMVNTGATIGRVAIVRDDERNQRTTFQKSVAIIKLDKKQLNPTFLKFIFLLRIKDFASVGSGSAIKNLLLSKMREFPILVPPLELQKDFEKIVLKMEQSSINKEECTVSKLELFNSLSQKAFAGEL